MSRQQKGVICVVGDKITDLYSRVDPAGFDQNYGCAVYRRQPVSDDPARPWFKNGGALAVRKMLVALGARVPDSPVFGFSRTSTRYLAPSGEVLLRIDSMTDHPRSALCGGGDMFVVVDYGLGTVTTALVEALLSTGKPCLFSPHGTTALEIVDRPWYGLVCNSQEYRQWPTARAPQRFCVTYGRQGLEYIDKEELDQGVSEWHHCPAIQANVVDTCGAGDQVLATIAWATMKGADWDTACVLANCAAGISCEKFGATEATLEELRERAPWASQFIDSNFSMLD